MERAERLDFDGGKGVRKPRTFLSRKPKSGSHTSFLNEKNHSSPWSAPPLDSRNVVKSDKGWDYEYNKSYEKSTREKSHGDSKESKDYSTGEQVERVRSRFSKTFKPKCNGDDLDRSGRFRGSGLERRDSNKRHDSHERLEHDLDRDQDQDRDRSPEVQGSMKCSKDAQGVGHNHKPLDIV